MINKCCKHVAHNKPGCTTQATLWKHGRMYIHKHAYVDARTYTHTYTDAWTYIHTHAHPSFYTYIRRRSYTHTLTFIYRRTYTYTHGRTRRHPCTDLPFLVMFESSKNRQRGRRRGVSIDLVICCRNRWKNGVKGTERGGGERVLNTQTKKPASSGKK